MQAFPLGTPAHRGEPGRCGVWAPWLKGLRDDGLTSSHVRSLWPLTGLLGHLAAGILSRSMAVSPGQWEYGGQHSKPFWKELCSLAPVAGVPDVTRGFRFSL